MLDASKTDPSPGSRIRLRISQTTQPRSSSSTDHAGGKATMSLPGEGAHGLRDPAADLVVAGDAAVGVLDVRRVRTEALHEVLPVAGLDRARHRALVVLERLAELSTGPSPHDSAPLGRLTLGKGQGDGDRMGP